MTEKKPSPLPEERLAEIEAREKAATPGPLSFRLFDREAGPDAFLIETHDGQEIGLAVKRQDAEFFARARQDIPDLLANLRRARAQRDELLIAVRDILKATSRPGTGEIPAALSRALAAVTRVQDEMGADLEGRLKVH